MAEITSQPIGGPDPHGDPAATASWFFENARDLFAVISGNGRRIRMVNPAWLTLTGWSAEDLIGRDLFDLVAEADRSSLHAVGRRLAAQGQAIAPFRLRTKAGDWLWLEGYARQGPGGDLMGSLRDVTGERRRRMRLEHAEQVRSLLATTAGVGLWCYDPRDGRIEWSGELLRLLGPAAATIMDSRGFAAACHPDDLEAVEAAIDRVVTTGRPAAFSHRMRVGGGRWIHLQVHVRGEPLGDGLHLAHGLSQDVTALVEAREAAMRAEAQSRWMVEAAPFAIALFDHDLRYAMASASWIELFHLEGRRYMGLRLDDLSPEIYGDFVRVQRRALAGETIRENEFRLVDTQGRSYWLRWEVAPWRDTSGEVVGVVVYVDDVSGVTAARRDAQAQANRLKIALGAAHAAVVETDFVRQTVWSSPELVSLSGYDLTADHLSDGIWCFVHPADHKRVERIVRGWFDGAPGDPIETRILRADGQERWVRIYTEFERGGDGRLVKIVNLMIDIDEGKRQELALIAAKRAAQAAAEAKSQFLANMSHEIRTPMNGVLGVLHLLQRQPLPPEASAMLAEALASGRMLQALLDDVVDFSRIEAGRLELTAEPLQPAALVESVAGLLRPQAEAKGLALAVETEGLPDWVLGDPVRLRQCLFNLTGNAVKFTSEGQVTVRAVYREEGDEPRLRLEVQDTGIGIDARTRRRLFTRFQQADASTTRRFGGSGLGLAITRKLAELMGGAVGLSSEPGAGSTFWLEIPARRAAAPRPAPTQAESALEGLRVLVVEDNPTNRMIATKLLESLGVSVQTAEDGEAGVAAAAHGGFDLILMDIQMPGIDGIEATRRIRALGGAAARTPVIALTANVLTHQRDHYLAAGMDGVVGKPVDPSVLLSEIARLAEAGVSPAAALSAT